MMDRPLTLRCIALFAALASPTTVMGLDRCFIDAGERYGIAPELLKAIARVESALDPHALSTNADHSVDVGLMQINSWWLPTLARHRIRGDDLWERCLNIHVGAWILASNIQRYGHTWIAVGAYNAGTAKDAATQQRREDYARRVFLSLSSDRRGVSLDAHVTR